MFTLNCRGKILAAERPLVMGIFNATPDSFFEGHLNSSGEATLLLLQKMVADGADMIDVGGQSTRPGSERISTQEEIDRVVPVIELAKKHFPDIMLSADTYSSKVATAAVHAGASIINDISGGNMDEAMLQTAAALKTPYICMHMQGTPATMQLNPHYSDVVKEVLDFFISRIAECKKAGITDIIVDPGFGFGKTIQHNFSLLKSLTALQLLQAPVLAGLSRKSTVYKTLHTTADKALNGTTVLNSMALMNGASILRVHDVKEAREAVTLFEAYKKAP